MSVLAEKLARRPRLRLKGSLVVGLPRRDGWRPTIPSPLT
jgi:hypothetical protein